MSADLDAWAAAGRAAAAELGRAGMTPPPRCYALLAAAVRRDRARTQEEDPGHRHPESSTSQSPSSTPGIPPASPRRDRAPA